MLIIFNFFFLTTAQVVADLLGMALGSFVAYCTRLANEIIDVNIFSKSN